MSPLYPSPACPPQSLPTNPTPHHALTLFVATELDCQLPFPEVEPFPSWWQCKKHFNQITYQPRLKHEYCVTRFLAGAAIATSLQAGGVTVEIVDLTGGVTSEIICISLAMQAGSISLLQ